MDRPTVEVYEDRGETWAANRRPVRRRAAQAFAARVPRRLTRVDLGCGAGRYTPDLGPRVIGIDAARAMLEQCRAAVPGIPLAQGDLEALPFGRQCLHGGWANMSYHHIPSVRLPLALGELHRVLAPGSPVDIQVLAGSYEGDALRDDDIGGRYFAAWQRERLTDVLVGAGFVDITMEFTDDVVAVGAVRARSLADTVGPGMRMLVVGLNPSLYAADAGVGFARPGNRFWPAALAAGLVGRDRDPADALARHGVGMTDAVKRATAGAAELSADEYRDGLARVDRLARWLEPRVVCMVGLAGWRALAGARAGTGLQERGIGGRPTYVMPSTSGANARTSLVELTGHLVAASACADGAPTIHDREAGLR
jgi:TDG/mug DNA glycosylase family protein